MGRCKISENQPEYVSNTEIETLKSTQNKDKNYSQRKSDKGEIYQSEPKNVELEMKILSLCCNCNIQKQTFKCKHVVNNSQSFFNVREKVHPDPDIQLQDVARFRWTGPALSHV